MMDLHDTLLAFSEWLDGQGFRGPDDGRTHDDLARQFADEWRSTPGAAPLASPPDPTQNSDRADTHPDTQEA